MNTEERIAHLGFTHAKGTGYTMAAPDLEILGCAFMNSR